jgi:hypothetical protein
MRESQGYPRRMQARCGSCGAPAAKDDRFCSRCGAPVQTSGARPCPGCGTPGEASDRFCRDCGTAFDGATSASTEATETDGFDDILAAWDLDLPPATTDPDTAPKTALATAPPQAPAETVLLDRPEPIERPLFADDEEEERTAPADFQLGRARAAGGFPWGATIALLGAVTVIISAILPWDGGGAVLPRDIPSLMLLDPAARGPNLGLVLLVAGTVGALVALLSMAVPAVGILRRLVGLATFAIPLAFTLRALGIGALLRPDQIVAALGVGAFAAAAGGLVQVVAGRWSLHRR